jgi:uncharacterized protein YggU (UPF0235/DUF167 family)
VTAWRIAGDDMLVGIRLTPGSARERLGGSWTDEAGACWLAARVRAVPEKGKANAALIALLAGALDWPKGAISLESGDTNRLKRLRIVGAARDAARLSPLLQTWVDMT